MKIFVSGLISNGENCPYEEWESNIAIGVRASVQLQVKGYQVVSPFLLQTEWVQTGLTYEEMMTLCMIGISFCDAIYMVPGWEQSAGATKERLFATELGKPIIYDITEL